MDKKRFELWLPFTAAAIGVAERDLLAVHNRPMKLALSRVNRLSPDWECSVVYFTERTSFFSQSDGGLAHRFFPVSFRKRHHSSTFGRQFSLSALRHLVLNPPDYAGLYGGYGRFTMTAAWVCRLRRIPYYVHFGGWPVPSDSTLRRLMQNATYVITFTERQRRWMAAQGIYSGHNTASWSMGVDVDTFHPDDLSRHSDSHYPRLLYVGRITHNKGVLEAIQAFRAIRTEFPGAILDVIGSHQDVSFVEQVQAYLEEYDLQDAVNLPGAVPYEELSKWYAAADLLLFPSPLESFGFVVVESMACGTPVIAMRGSGGPEEIIAHGKDGILTDLPNLALDVIRLLRDPTRLSQMGSRAVGKVRAEYTLEQTAQKFASFLDGLPAGIR